MALVAIMHITTGTGAPRRCACQLSHTAHTQGSVPHTPAGWPRPLHSVAAGFPRAKWKLPDLLRFWPGLALSHFCRILLAKGRVPGWARFKGRWNGLHL